MSDEQKKVIKKIEVMYTKNNGSEKIFRGGKKMGNEQKKVIKKILPIHPEWRS